jgi:diadenosine tetraphosphate (Ap4A) HIT family hydrolase
MQWDNWANGIKCPFCNPRSESSHYRGFIKKLDVSSLYLSGNQTYRGHCILILDIRHATRPDQLSPDEWSSFCADVHRAEGALLKTLQPDHVNIELMGNVIPHMHWHIVPRYRRDGRWGGPIWTTTTAEMLTTNLQTTEREELIQTLRTMFANS